LLDGSLTVDFESDDYEDPTFDQDWQKQEASRLIDLVKGKTMAFSDDSSDGTVKIAMPKIATPSLGKKPKKGKTVASGSDSSSAASKTATPSLAKQPKQALGKQPKQALGKQPKQEASRLINLVKGKTIASSSDSSGASSKIATQSSGKQS
jgi:hypothetical protein